jgi:hypothetical protein
MLTHRTPHHFGWPSFRCSRSESPESIERQSRWKNGFSDAQLRIIARDFVAPRNDGESYATISFNTPISASGAVTFGA